MTEYPRIEAIAAREKAATKGAGHYQDFVANAPRDIRYLLAQLHDRDEKLAAVEAWGQDYDAWTPEWHDAFLAALHPKGEWLMAEIRSDYTEDYLKLRAQNTAMAAALMTLRARATRRCDAGTVEHRIRMADSDIRLIDAALSDAGAGWVSPEVRETGRVLCEKLDEIMAHPSYVSVFTQAHNHGFPYNGPTWEKALEAHRAALDTPKEEK